MLPHLPFPETQATLALSIFLFTFAYEDGATLLAAALGAAGRLDVRLGFASAFLGIWAGDMGLYALGSSVAQRAIASRWLSRHVSHEALARAGGWFQRRGAWAIIASRFVPGSRLPLYVAAGALKLPARTFIILTGVCSSIWVAGIFAILRFTPAAPFLGGHKARWALAVALLAGPLLLTKVGGQIFKRAQLLVRKYRRWEFWPAWMFYPPVAAMCAWLSVKYRGLSLPTVANPAFRNGGMIGESKVEILRQVMKAAPGLAADGYLIAEYEPAERLRRLEQLRADHNIGFPFVLKPNVGQRGAGFKVITTAEQAERYLEQVRSDVVLQRYADAPREVGIFYYRFPGSSGGEIFAVTEKIFPVVVGDGRSTLAELIEADPRASLIARIYLERFPKSRERVVPAGERVRLVEAGNHCQGCIFRDGSHLISEALRARIDEISQKIPGFFIGRYDIRYTSDEDLRHGVNFSIVELNGAASEATNIYDESNTLLQAYRTLYRQWELVYAIGAANRERGSRPPSVLAFLRDWKTYQTVSADYPAAD